jgi:AraC-like DNA-binding protein
MISASVTITLISIFSLQTTIFIYHLISKKPHRQSSVLLCLVLFFFGTTAFNLALFYLLVFFNHINWIPYLQLELLFGLGPSLYLYTKSVADPGYKVHKWQYLHFLPVTLEFLYYRTSFFRSGAINLTDYPHGLANWSFIIEQWGGTVTTSAYIIASIKLLTEYQSWVRNNYANLNGKTLEWLIKPVIAYASFWFLWHIIRLVDLIIYSDAYREYYFFPMFITLAAITCWIAFTGYMRKQTDAVGFTTNRKSKHPLINRGSDIPSAAAQLIRDKMGSEKFYLDLDLSLQSFSKAIGLNPKLVSKTINTEFNVNFLEFVNQYRVSEFMWRLKRPGHEKLTLWAHALESGFASKSTFNYVFKKHNKLTPKAYYQQNRK